VQVNVPMVLPVGDDMIGSSKRIVVAIVKEEEFQLYGVEAQCADTRCLMGIGGDLDCYVRIILYCKRPLTCTDPVSTTSRANLGNRGRLLCDDVKFSSCEYGNFLLLIFNWCFSGRTSIAANDSMNGLDSVTCLECLTSFCPA
jgi:hypothetical protein